MSRFFDAIHTNNKLNNTIESFFYWEGISDRLGYRKFRYTPEKIENLPNQKGALKWLKTAVKIALCFTLILPLICLFAKLCLRHMVKKPKHKIHPSNSSPSEISKQVQVDRSWQEIDETLEVLRAQVKRDAATGKIVFAKEVVDKRYKDILNAIEKKDLTTEEKERCRKQYNTILNEEMVSVELKKRFRSKIEPRTWCERVVCEKMGLGHRNDSLKREIAIEAEKNVLTHLLERCVGADQDLTDFKKDISALLLQQRLKAALGKFACRFEFLSQLIRYCETWYQNCQNQLDQQTYSIPLPKQSKRGLEALLPEIKESYLRGKLEKRIQHSLPSLKTYEHEKLNGFQNDLEKHSNPIKPFSNYLETLIAEDSAFYKKWGGYLKAEFQQGAGDPDQVLGAGVCLALSTRWATYDQTHPNATCEEIVQSKQVLPKDRYNQALYQNALFRKKVTEKDAHITTALNIHQHFGVVNSKKIAEIDNFKKATSIPNGVYVMIVPRHQIYFRKGEKNNRIGDPNRGIFLLPTEQQFQECMKDLLSFYDKGAYTIYQLEL